jgi:hypothetical protein
MFGSQSSGNQIEQQLHTCTALLQPLGVARFFSEKGTVAESRAEETRSFIKQARHITTEEC